MLNSAFLVICLAGDSPEKAGPPRAVGNTWATPVADVVNVLPVTTRRAATAPAYLQAVPWRNGGVSMRRPEVGGRWRQTGLLSRSHGTVGSKKGEGGNVT